MSGASHRSMGGSITLRSNLTESARWNVNAFRVLSIELPARQTLDDYQAAELERRRRSGMLDYLVEASPRTDIEIPVLGQDEDDGEGDEP